MMIIRISANFSGSSRRIKGYILFEDFPNFSQQRFLKIHFHKQHFLDAKRRLANNWLGNCLVGKISLEKISSEKIYVCDIVALRKYLILRK